MISSYPLMFNPEISMQELGSLPSSGREFLNIKRHSVKRGLWLPPRTDNPEFAEGDLATITLNNSGLAHQADIFSGKVRKPDRYQQVTDLQAYLQLVHDADRTPTEAEIIEARADDIGLDARLIQLINNEAEKGNYYANESQNFQKTLQKSVNSYFKEEAKYRVPMQLDEGLPSLFELATRQGIKKAERAALKPLDQFRSKIRDLSKQGKATASAISAVAKALGYSEYAEAAGNIADFISRGQSLDRLFSSIEQNPQQTLTEEFLRGLSNL